MKTIFAVAAAVMMLAVVPSATAQNSTGNNTELKEPGFLKPKSALYGLEVAWDNAAVSIGLKRAAQVAQERAAEARVMARRGNYGAAQRAAKNMAQIAQRAKSGDVPGLQKAERVLERVMQNAPEQAQQGLRNALQNVRNARGNAANRTRGNAPGMNRTPGTTPGSGGPQPDSGRPSMGGNASAGESAGKPANSGSPGR